MRSGFRGSLLSSRPSHMSPGKSKPLERNSCLMSFPSLKARCVPQASNCPLHTAMPLKIEPLARHDRKRARWQTQGRETEGVSYLRRRSTSKPSARGGTQTLNHFLELPFLRLEGNVIPMELG